MTTNNIPDFSKPKLLYLLETITQMVLTDELSETDQMGVFERLTSSTKPDPYAIECLVLGWVIKNYSTLDSSETPDPNESSESGSI